MAWDAATDTFWVLYRNAELMVNYDVDGEVIVAFPHPAPLYQDLVYNHGLAVDPRRHVLYLSSAGPLDRQVTKIVELTRRGELTGVEIPVGSGFYSKIRGFDLEPQGLELTVSSSVGSVSDLVLYRAFDPLAPVNELSCANGAGGVQLSWTNNGDYDAISVFRGGEEVATLPGSALSWLDENPPVGAAFYRVAARRGDFTSPGTVCYPAGDRPFVRGDVEENGDLNLSDAVVILGFLFVGGAEPMCLDAADVDDNGEVNITDPIGLLTYLFLSGLPPAFPHPLPGYDMTADGLTCPE
jgi:hypothetical protein